MNQIICTLVVLLSIGTHIKGASIPVEPYIFEAQINETLEGIRPSIPDPLRIDLLNIDIPENDLISGGANISQFSLRGLQEFELTYLHIGIIGLGAEFVLVFPEINLNTQYWADITIAELIPLYGNGTANVNLKGLEISGSANVNITGGISISNVVVKIQIDQGVFDIHGILDDDDFSWIVSSILNDIVVKFIDENQELITSIISPIAEAIINAVLGSLGESATTTAPQVIFKKRA